jgi:glutamyl-tRNA synthetase
VLAPAAALVEAAATAFSALPEWTEASLEVAGNAVCAEQGVKLGKLAQPLRVALIGQKVGPGLWQSLALLGRETSLRRMRTRWS